MEHSSVPSSCNVHLVHFSDLGRMFNLVSRIRDGLVQLRTLLENHICHQGLNALEKCGDQAFSVSLVTISYPEITASLPLLHSCSCVTECVNLKACFALTLKPVHILATYLAFTGCPGFTWSWKVMKVEIWIPGLEKSWNLGKCVQLMEKIFISLDSDSVCDKMSKLLKHCTKHQNLWPKNFVVFTCSLVGQWLFLEEA